ncbi:MAG TPA: hypothetical protein PKC18_08825, partial [Lacipirellulaceae bacterium]|nr:hypothetical protein [Lacipirellulaceae bacterium]
MVRRLPRPVVNQGGRRAGADSVSNAPQDYPPLPENIRSVQPGGGWCYEIELAWGRLRRWYLKRFRPGFVRRMAARRHGSDAGAPHEILDPRDLKYCINQCTARWDEEDDPFAWRDRLPVVRWGLAELQLGGGPLLLLALVVGAPGPPWCYGALVPLALLAWWISFFRHPRRRTPREADAVVAPADGTVADVTELDHYDFLDGPA